MSNVQYQYVTPQQQQRDRIDRMHQVAAEVQDLYDSPLIVAAIKDNKKRLEAAKYFERIVLNASYKNYRNKARKSKEARLMAGVAYNTASQLEKELNVKSSGSGTYPVNNLSPQQKQTVSVPQTRQKIFPIFPKVNCLSINNVYNKRNVTEYLKV